MEDKLLIITKIKKTILYIEKIVNNYPHKDLVLKNKILKSSYELLELAYKSNIIKEKLYIKECIVKIRMIEFYFKCSFEKKLISYKQFTNLGSYLLEINKMLNSWILYEKNK